MAVNSFLTKKFLNCQFKNLLQFALGHLGSLKGDEYSLHSFFRRPDNRQSSMEATEWEPSMSTLIP